MNISCRLLACSAQFLSLYAFFAMVAAATGFATHNTNNEWNQKYIPTSDSRHMRAATGANPAWDGAVPRAANVLMGLSFM